MTKIRTSIRNAGPTGRTCEELGRDLALTYSTVYEHVVKLSRAGAVQDSGLRRGVPGDRDNVVWHHAQGSSDDIEMGRVDPEQIHPRLKEAVKALQKADEFALDLETFGLTVRKGSIETVIVCTKPDREHCFPIPVQSPGQDVAILDTLEPFYTDPEKTCVTHGGGFDIRQLWAYGKDIKSKHADTEITSWFRAEDAMSHGLKQQAEIRYGIKRATYEQSKVNRLPGMGESFDDYCYQDGIDTLRMWKDDKKSVLNDPAVANLFWTLEMPILRVLARMKVDGVPIDSPYLQSQLPLLRSARKATYDRFKALAGRDVLLDSPQDVAKALFIEAGIPWKDLKLGQPNADFPGGVPSTAKEVLKKLRDRGHEIAKVMLQYRSQIKDEQLFEAMAEEARLGGGYVYPTFLQTGTATGRFAAIDPNLQQLPQKSKSTLRKCVAAPPGWVYIGSDFSQAELRVMAHRAQEPTMINIYRTGGDIHTLTASGCGCTRSVAKGVNFGFLYGMGAETLQANLYKTSDVWITKEQAYEYRLKYFDTYRGISTYHAAVKSALRQSRDKTVRTLFGNKRHLARLWSLNDHEAERVAINYTIQGSVAVMIKIAMRNIAARIEKERLQDQLKLITQIHDELGCLARVEVAKEMSELVHYEMEHILKQPLLVPFTASIGVGPTWYDAK